MTNNTFSILLNYYLTRKHMRILYTASVCIAETTGGKLHCPTGDAKRCTEGVSI